MSGITGKGAVRPRDAASLILTRTDPRSGEIEILMGRRRKKASFIPDMFVFPGGRVDREDAHVMPARPLHATTTLRLERFGAARATQARALANAAIRETFEETGLILGVKHSGVSHHTNHGWAAFADAGFAPDHAPLRFLGRAITPRSSPVRFHARFFLADGKHVEGSISGSGELTELAWYPLSQARALPVIDVTDYMLALVAEAIKSDLDPPPLFSYRRNRPLLAPKPRPS